MKLTRCYCVCVPNREGKASEVVEVYARSERDAKTLVRKRLGLHRLPKETYVNLKAWGK